MNILVYYAGSDEIQRHAENKYILSIVFYLVTLLDQ